MPATQTFVEDIAPDVIAACVNTGVYPSVVIAQAIEESASGSSTLARLYNNLFGHVASSTWFGRKVQTVAGGRFWRAYNSVADCIVDHIKILKKPAYLLAGVVNAASPFQQAQAIQQAGYNAGPDRNSYAAKLSQIIRAYNLQQYDKQLADLEKTKNSNHLAFHQQSGLSQLLQTIV